MSDFTDFAIPEVIMPPLEIIIVIFLFICVGNPSVCEMILTFFFFFVCLYR